MNSLTQHPEADRLREAFRSVYDPEFGVSIEDLGLIYAIETTADGRTRIEMTLTSAYCPAGDVILEGVKSAAASIVGEDNVEVDLVWTPPWTPERLSADGRAQLGWDEQADG